MGGGVLQFSKVLEMHLVLFVVKLRNLLSPTGGGGKAHNTRHADE